LNSNHHFHLKIWILNEYRNIGREPKIEILVEVLVKNRNIVQKNPIFGRKLKFWPAFEILIEIEIIIGQIKKILVKIQILVKY